MIKSTKVSTKFGNFQKLKQLHSFIDEYRNVVSQFVDLLWKIEKIPILLPKNPYRRVLYFKELYKGELCY